MEASATRTRRESRRRRGRARTVCGGGRFWWGRSASRWISPGSFTTTPTDASSRRCPHRAPRCGARCLLSPRRVRWPPVTLVRAVTTIPTWTLFWFLLCFSSSVSTLACANKVEGIQGRDECCVLLLQFNRCIEFSWLNQYGLRYIAPFQLRGVLYSWRRGSATYGSQ